MMIGMLLFWALIILGIVFLVRYSGDNAIYRRENKNTALEILNERYARGEIDTKEYEEKKRMLAS